MLRWDKVILRILYSPNQHSIEFLDIPILQFTYYPLQLLSITSKVLFISFIEVF